MNDFLVICLDFIVSIIGTIIFWKFLLVDFDSYKEWSTAGLVLIGIFGNASWAIGEIFAGAWGLSEKITAGKLDKYLCRPVGVVFALVLEDMQLEELIKGGISLAVLLTWHTLYFGNPINVINIFMAIASMTIGVIIVALIRCIYSCFAFWFPNTEGMNVFIHMEDLELDRYPLEIFRKPARIIFMTVIPVAFVSCIPAMLYLGIMDNGLTWLGIEVTIMIIMCILLKIIWKGGIHKYEASGG